jgi:hypothetical protein
MFTKTDFRFSEFVSREISWVILGMMQREEAAMLMFSVLMG